MRSAVSAAAAASGRRASAALAAASAARSVGAGRGPTRRWRGGIAAAAGGGTRSVRRRSQSTVSFPPDGGAASSAAAASSGDTPPPPAQAIPAHPSPAADSAPPADSAAPAASAAAGGEEDGGSLVSSYESMVLSGSVRYDQHQLRAFEELDRLLDGLLRLGPGAAASAGDGGRGGGGGGSGSIGDEEERESSTPWPSLSPPADSAFALGGLGGLLGSLFSSGPSETVERAPSSPMPRGVYLHGGVGCGKTFCMELFYDAVPGDAISKQKVHFHKFMLGIHKQMHEAKMVEGVRGDVLPRVIENTIKDGRLICFDEFQVTDVADALILRRLFTGLLDRGAVVVATSNRPPRDLYLNGLQRDRFIPFIDLLEEKTAVVSMWESDTDYRLVHGERRARGVYFIGPKSIDDFDDAFAELCEYSPAVPTSLTVQGRKVPIRLACLDRGVARFSFGDLCKSAMGAADYLAVAETFHTVFVEDVPAMTMNEINWVRRFITFVDVMYECRVKLILQAATLPRHLFFVDLDNRFQDEAFAFDRTRSRLDEMGGEAYLTRRWVGRDVKEREGRPSAIVGPEPGLQY